MACSYPTTVCLNVHDVVRLYMQQLCGRHLVRKGRRVDVARRRFHYALTAMLNCDFERNPRSLFMIFFIHFICNDAAELAPALPFNILSLALRNGSTSESARSNPGCPSRSGKISRSESPARSGSPSRFWFSVDCRSPRRVL